MNTGVALWVERRKWVTKYPASKAKNRVIDDDNTDIRSLNWLSSTVTHRDANLGRASRLNRRRLRAKRYRKLFLGFADLDRDASICESRLHDALSSSRTRLASHAVDLQCDIWQPFFRNRKLDHRAAAAKRHPLSRKHIAPDDLHQHFGWTVWCL